VKLDDVRRAVEFGADEIDMVIDRGAMLSRRYTEGLRRDRATKEACGPAHLKVILETGELGTYDVVRKASQIAMLAGGDFIKTSTGKIQPAATPPVTLVMLEAIRDFYYATGKIIGMKPAGGIRTAKQALHYLVMVKETLGDRWLTPDLFRFGASTLLNDVLMQLEKERTGAYQGEATTSARTDTERPNDSMVGGTSRSEISRWFETTTTRGGSPARATRTRDRSSAWPTIS
jgi:deoxyribose-phosphate aldolase